MRWLFVLAGAALAGCGGGLEERLAGTPAGALPVRSFTVAEFRATPPVISYIPADIPVRAAPPPAPRELAPATSEEPVLTLVDEAGASFGTFELQAVRGRGFPTLRLMLSARRLGETAPPQPVRPYCREEGRCDYLLSQTYTVALSDSADLTLVPRGEGVAIVARALQVDAPRAVDVVLRQDERVLGRKRIVLLSE